MQSNAGDKLKDFTIQKKLYNDIFPTVLIVFLHKDDFGDLRASTNS